MGIGKALISRISHTPLPLPANLPHAPKILKKADKLPVAIAVPASSDSKSGDHTHARSHVNNHTEQNNLSTKFHSEKDCNNENTNESENENCQINTNNFKYDDNSNDNSSKHCLPDKKIFLEQQYKKFLSDSVSSNTTERKTEMAIENTEMYENENEIEEENENENEKDYGDSSDIDLEIDMDMDLGYDSGDNCNNDIENNENLNMRNNENDDDNDNNDDDDDDDDVIDLIDFDTGYVGTSRLWSNRNGKILPVENGINDTHDTDIKDVSNLIEDSSTVNINKKSNDTADADAESSTKTSFVRYRKSPLNSTSNTEEPVVEKRAGMGTPRCGPNYQADVEPFNSRSTLSRPMDNVRTHMNADTSLFVFFPSFSNLQPCRIICDSVHNTFYFFSTSFLPTYYIISHSSKHFLKCSKII